MVLLRPQLASERRCFVPAARHSDQHCVSFTLGNSLRCMLWRAFRSGTGSLLRCAYGSKWHVTGDEFIWLWKHSDIWICICRELTPMLCQLRNLQPLRVTSMRLSCCYCIWTTSCGTSKGFLARMRACVCVMGKYRSASVSHGSCFF